MSITVKNPESLYWKHPSIKGISTKSNVITSWDDSLPSLTQELIDGYDKEYQSYLDSTAYISARQKEYPSIGDQLDAIWKSQNGDSTEVNAMLLKINEVKAKHPKQNK